MDLGYDVVDRDGLGAAVDDCDAAQQVLGINLGDSTITSK
jgi:hypothetical protein